LDADDFLVVGNAAKSEPEQAWCPLGLVNLSLAPLGLVYRRRVDRTGGILNLKIRVHKNENAYTILHFLNKAHNEVFSELKFYF